MISSDIFKHGGHCPERIASISSVIFLKASSSFFISFFNSIIRFLCKILQSSEALDETFDINESSDELIPLDISD